MALKGLKVIEIAGLAPAPFCGLMLSDFGANVIRVDRPDPSPLDSMTRGKRNVIFDLKKDAGKGIFKRLCADADVLIEPFRPGVMERLGLGPEPMMQLNKRLIYARLSGFGQDGPYAKRAGHDINYLAISGVLSFFVHKNKPIHPMNMLADFAGGGHMCMTGILLALLERNQSNLGQVIDVSMVEGARYVSTYLWSTQKQDFKPGQFVWPKPKEKETNLLDGGAHFYTTYQTKDNRWISVGAIEPQFYERLLQVLQRDGGEFPQFEIDRWPEMKVAFGEIFAQKTLQEWIDLFDGADACVEPVLEFDEADSYSKVHLRPSFNEDGTPVPAPRLSRTPGAPNLREANFGEHTAEILKEHGYSDTDIVNLSEQGVIQCNIDSKL